MSSVDADWGADWGALPEDHVHFEGPCTCEHERAQHGWGECDVEGCECEAGWAE